MSPPSFPPPQGAAWDELRDAAPLQVWLDVAVEIAARHGLPAGAPSLFPSGSDVVVRVGDAVVKLSEPRWRAEIAAEADLLARVVGHLPLATPEVLATGDHHGWPYVVMSFVPGRALGEVWPRLDHAARLQLAVEIGHLLDALGRLPVPEAQAEAWPPFLSRMATQATARLSGRKVPISPEWSGRIAPFLEANPVSERALAWMHTELLGEHLLVSEAGGQVHLSAMLDFADGRVGHPYYEIPAVVEFLFQGEPGLLRALLLAWGHAEDALTPALSRELCAWGLIHQFGSLSRALAAAGAPEPEDLDALAERLYGLAPDAS